MIDESKLPRLEDLEALANQDEKNLDALEAAKADRDTKEEQIILDDIYRKFSEAVLSSGKSILVIEDVDSLLLELITDQALEDYGKRGFALDMRHISQYVFSQYKKDMVEASGEKPAERLTGEEIYKILSILGVPNISMDDIPEDGKIDYLEQKVRKSQDYWNNRVAVAYENKTKGEKLSGKDRERLYLVQEVKAALESGSTESVELMVRSIIQNNQQENTKKALYDYNEEEKERKKLYQDQSHVLDGEDSDIEDGLIGDSRGPQKKAKRRKSGTASPESKKSEFGDGILDEEKSEPAKVVPPPSGPLPMRDPQVIAIDQEPLPPRDGLAVETVKVKDELRLPEKSVNELNPEAELSDIAVSLRKALSLEPDLLKNESVQSILKEAEEPYQFLDKNSPEVGDLEQDARSKAKEYFVNRGDTLFEGKNAKADLIKKVREIHTLDIDALKDGLRGKKKKELTSEDKQHLKDIKLYNYIDRAWKNLSAKQKESYAQKLGLPVEDESVKLEFVAFLARERFDNIKLNCKKDIVVAATASSAEDKENTSKAAQLFDLERQDERFKDFYTVEAEDISQDTASRQELNEVARELNLAYGKFEAETRQELKNLNEQSKNDAKDLGLAELDKDKKPKKKKPKGFLGRLGQELIDFEKGHGPRAYVEGIKSIPGEVKNSASEAGEEFSKVAEVGNEYVPPIVAEPEKPVTGLRWLGRMGLRPFRWALKVAFGAAAIGTGTAGVLGEEGNTKTVEEAANQVTEELRSKGRRARKNRRDM